jgi:hypothetical protein
VWDRTLGEPVGGRKAVKISVSLKVEFCNSGEGEIVALSKTDGECRKVRTDGARKLSL